MAAVGPLEFKTLGQHVWAASGPVTRPVRSFVFGQQWPNPAAPASRSSSWPTGSRRAATWHTWHRHGPHIPIPTDIDMQCGCLCNMVCDDGVGVGLWSPTI